MKRIQLFEFEDQPWFPDTLRISLTRLIMVLHKLTGLSPIIKRELDDLMQKSNQRKVIDMGSGAGGAMEDVHQLYINSNEPIEILLSDLYPNQKTIARINNQNHAGLKYHNSSVDAVDAKTVPDGIRTMLNSFHHMPPQKAKDIL